MTDDLTKPEEVATQKRLSFQLSMALVKEIGTYTALAVAASTLLSIIHESGFYAYLCIKWSMVPLEITDFTRGFLNWFPFFLVALGLYYGLLHVPGSIKIKLKSGLMITEVKAELEKFDHEIMDFKENYRSMPIDEAELQLEELIQKKVIIESKGDDLKSISKKDDALVKSILIFAFVFGLLIVACSALLYLSVPSVPTLILFILCIVVFIFQIIVYFFKSAVPFFPAKGIMSYTLR